MQSHKYQGNYHTGNLYNRLIEVPLYDLTGKCITIDYEGFEEDKIVVGEFKDIYVDEGQIVIEEKKYSNGSCALVGNYFVLIDENTKKVKEYYYSEELKKENDEVLWQTLYDENHELVFDKANNYAVYKNGYIICKNSKYYFIDENYNEKIICEGDKKIVLDNEFHFENTIKKWAYYYDNKAGVIDENGNVLISNLKNVGVCYEDYFVFQNGFRYGYMDYDGKILIDFSIFDSTYEDSKNSDNINEEWYVYEEEY